jgi:hypothetical protein
MFIYVAQNTSNGHDLSSKYEMMKTIRAASCQSISRAVPIPILRTEVAAQARYYHRIAPCLNHVVLGPARRTSDH